MHNLQSKLLNHYKRLHLIPEIGFALSLTRKYVTDSLSSIGISSQIIGRGSILAQIGDGQKFVLLRADMDALQIKENSGIDYASTNGNMHACGHDMHTAMLLGVAELLVKDPPKDRGVLLLFQAAEETLEGALDTIESGVLNRYAIESAFALHVSVGTPFKSGSIILPPSGVIAPGAETFSVQFIGIAAHGAMPHFGKSALYPAMDFINRMDRLISNGFAPEEKRLLSFGRLEVGSSVNVIPYNARIFGNFRYFSENVRNEITDALRKSANEIASLYNCIAKVDRIGGCPPIINNADLRESAYKVLEQNGLNVIDGSILAENNTGLGGSDDFSVIAQWFPSVYLSICAGRREDGYIEPLHSSKTVFDTAALLYGARALAALANK